MPKTLVVAWNEYVSAVSSKAFMVGVLLMPVFMGGTFVVRHLTRDQVDVTDRRVAIVDPTGRLFAVLAAQAAQRNQSVYKVDEAGQRTQTRPRFLLERYSAEDGAERADIVLSQRVRKRELFGFLLIDDQDPAAETASLPLSYHTQTPSYSELPNWLEQTANAEIQRLRMERLNLDPSTFQQVTQRVPLRRFGLVQADQAGNVIDAKEENRILTLGVPFGGMMLMFMMVMTVAPTMLNNVLEEKMQKIAEFLVASVSPFELMLGKVMGGVAVAATLSLVYLGAAYGLARFYEFDDRIPTTVYLWFLFFVLLALIIYGSIFAAIGAACSEIRDAQGLMTPVMLMVIIPMLCLGPVLESPASLFSRTISLIPPATPMLMFVRIAIPPGPAFWEVALAVTLVIGFAVACVWAAGRVFRIGILTQGQPATLGTLVRWVIAK